MLGAATSFKYVFDTQTDAHKDVFFCTADCGWITGHTYVAYGPLLNGATQIVFEGVPSWPDAGRLWRIVDQHKVTHLYTAPTAIRALMRSGDDPVTATSRASLKLLGSVGEPINPEAWRWYREVVGDDRCPVVRFAAPHAIDAARSTSASKNAGRHVVADRDGRDPDRADDGRRRGPAQARRGHDARRRLRARVIGRDDGRGDPGGYW